MALSKERRLEILRSYGDGLLPVGVVVEAFRRFRQGGRYRHPLWDRNGLFYVDDCFEHLSESKMIELLRALIDEDPGFPLIPSPRNERGGRKTFLFVALGWASSKGDEGVDPNEGNTSLNVLRLLMVPGVTRLHSSLLGRDYECTPLQQASEIFGLDPAVLHHLIDLDHGSLLVTSRQSMLPLHEALLASTPASERVIDRMIELAPEALFHQSDGIQGTQGCTPVTFALNCRAVTPDRARLLQRLVERHPRAVQPGVVTTSGTALRVACRNAYQDAGLIEAIVRTYPPALCVSRVARIMLPRRLPYEVAAEREGPKNGTPALEFLQHETIEMALAAVEYALQSTTTTTAFADSGSAAVAASVATPASATNYGGDSDEYYYHDDKDDHVTRVEKFRLRVLASVSRAILPSESATATTTSSRSSWIPIMSGFAWALALREHDRCMDVCRELFVCPITSCLVLEDLKFRNAVLGTTSTNLYRMNKAGGRASVSPHHQVRLLALVKDDLDSIYLQFREFGSAHLVPTGRKRRPHRKRKAIGFYCEGRRWR
jgi:hypothetical protein